MYFLVICHKQLMRYYFNRHGVCVYECVCVCVFTLGESANSFKSATAFG